MYNYFRQGLGALFILFLSGNICSAQWRIPADSIYQLIKSNSIHRSMGNWSEIESGFQSCIQSSKGNADVVKCFVKVFEGLKDVHSHLIYKNQLHSFQPVNKPDSINRMTSLRDRIKSEDGKITSSMLSDKYAYIRVPGLSNWNELNNYANNLAAEIGKYNNPKTKGFIIDLRLNTGGPLAAMLSGLHALLGEGNIGNEIDGDENILRSWKMEGGNFIQHGYKSTSVVATSAKLDQIPVVILTGPATKSAGSWTAIAFKSRMNTHFVGEPTANGYTTSFQWIPISKDLVLNLADAYVTDRKKRIYPYFVPPDVQITGGDNYDNLMQDNKVKYAIRWFEKKR
jgi:hypothetical protein